MPRRSIPTPHDMQVGERVRELRKERGLSMCALAELAGISKGHLSSVEAGLQSITVKTIEAIAKGLNVPSMYLLTRPDEDERQHVSELLRSVPIAEVKAIRKQVQGLLRR